MREKKSNIPVITLDGPGGTGKGTICHMLAKHLNWHCLDSGNVYRQVAFHAQQQKIDFADIPALIKLIQDIQSYITEGDELELRSEQCGQNASRIAAIPEIRKALLDCQRSFAKPPGLVTDGRDMGTVIFPDAILKLYLTASIEERALRRFQQLQKAGITVNLSQVTDELAARDRRDSQRDYAPLKQAPDAILIDTTKLNIDQVFEFVLKYVRATLGEAIK